MHGWKALLCQCWVAERGCGMGGIVLCLTPGQGMGLLQRCVCTAAACVGHPVDPQLQAQASTRWAVEGASRTRGSDHYSLLCLQTAWPPGLEIVAHRSHAGCCSS